MKKKKKILMAILLFPALAAIYLGIVTLGGQHSYQEDVIDVALTWGDDQETVQAFFEEYSGAAGIPVAADTRLREDDLDNILSGDNPPDVLILSTGELAGKFASDGALLPLDAAARARGVDLEDFYPASLAQCRDGGNQLVCMPWGSDVYALYWNKALFSEAGLDPDRPPQTLEELVTYAAELTQLNQEGSGSEQVGFLPDFPRSYLDQYAHMFAGMPQPSTDAEAFAPAAAAALQWELRFFAPDDQEALNSFIAQVNPYRNSSHPSFAGRRANCQQCHRTAPGNSKKMPDHAFYDQNIAMMIDGQWQEGAGYLPASAPDLAYGVAPIPSPAGSDELRGSAVIQGPVILIPATAEDPEAAADFVSWLLSPAKQADAARAFSFLPARISAGDFLSEDDFPNLAVFLSVLQDENTAFNGFLEGSAALNQALTAGEAKVLHQGLAPELLLTEISGEHDIAAAGNSK